MTTAWDSGVGGPWAKTRRDLKVKWVVNCRNLFDDPQFSDVILECCQGSQRLFAHKVILAANSEYFRALFYGGWKESRNDVLRIEDVDFKAFKRLVRCFYFNDCEVDDFSYSGILLFHELANRFIVKRMEELISSYINEKTNIGNVVYWYQAAQETKLDRFSVQFMNYFESNFDLFLKRGKRNFLIKLPKDWILKIAQCSSLTTPEIEIFDALKDYNDHNYTSKEDKKLLMSCVKLELIDKKQLITKVRPSRIYTDTEILNSMETRLKYGLKKLSRNEPKP